MISLIYNKVIDSNRESILKTWYRQGDKKWLTD